MTNLSNHTTSLEQSRKLYELGFRKQSIYYWTIPEGNYVEEFMKHNPAYETDEASPRTPQLTDNPDFYGIYGEPVTKVPAYLLSEIMDILEDRIVADGKYYFLIIDKEGKLWKFGYDRAGENHIRKVSKIPVEAACDLLIWCIEQGFISTK